ncbi:hypothetical protein PG637_08855 [Riemerella anatipestifer]|nr:hypothetical protein [Riemerella anatipestifer]MDY3325772.1 hypothetical protein [Riemerella anatipestifer]MDY3354314.1 hypothetical protein [Riemerella anatipestifer]
MKKILLILVLFFSAVSCGTDKKEQILTNQSIITLSNTKGMSDNLISEIISQNPTQFKVEKIEDIIYLMENNVSDRIIIEMKKSQKKEKIEEYKSFGISIIIGILIVLVSISLYHW